MTVVQSWTGPDGEIGSAAKDISREYLGAYREAPRLVEEHHNLERSQVEGGYGRRQLFELVQNGADELLGHRGRIQVVLTEDHLYCANQGRPLSLEGIRALQAAHVSAKRGIQIGRFGLGFKSVLGISTSPEVFSTSGSVRFDRGHSKDLIEQVLGRPVQRVPVLRLAIPVDPGIERAGDAVLDELMGWASTVVRLRRDASGSSWLHDDIAEFPAHFLLFSPHVETLVLEDRVRDVVRTITLRHDADVHVLSEGTTDSRWRVFHTVHEPSPVARADAGTHANRDQIPIAWAVPTDRPRRGEFWAFFPTLETTTLSGILNAPWKLNEDRTRIIESPFNDELLKAACRLVMTSLPPLAHPSEPGLVLDLLPGRGRELLGWADGVVTKHINENVGLYPCIPDQTGVLRRPSDVKIHQAGLPRGALDRWASAAGRPDGWAHASVESRERRPRLETYMAASGTVSKPVDVWLEALVPSPDIEASTQALAVAALAAMEADEDLRQGVLSSKVVLTEDGGLAAPDDPNLFLRAPLPLEVASARYVEEKTASRAADALAALGVRPVETIRLLRALLKRDVRTFGKAEWDLFWNILRQTEPVSARREIDDAGLGPADIHVRCATGGYVPLVDALLPGPIIPGDSTDDRGLLIDPEFHGADDAHLQILGAVGTPTPHGGRVTEPWFTEYEDEALARYLEQVRRQGALPNAEYLRFRTEPFAGPLNPLRRLSDAGRARYVAALLSATDTSTDWEFGHSTQSRYPTMSFTHPVFWMVRKYGMLETSRGLERPWNAVGPSLVQLGEILPVARISPSAAERLGLPATHEDLPDELWESMLAGLAATSRDAVIEFVYVGAAQRGIPRPETLRCRVGNGFEGRRAEGIAVAADDHSSRVLTRTGQPFIRVGTERHAEYLSRKWGLRPASEAITTRVSWAPGGESELLIDVFPLLRMHLDDTQRELSLVPCSELTVETFTDEGRLADPRPSAVEGEAVYVLADLVGAPLLRVVADALGLSISEEDVQRIIDNVEENRVRIVRAQMLDASSDVERLLLGIGADALRRRISKALIDAVESCHGELDAEGIARLSLAVHGVRVLQEHADDLERAGLTPPSSWGGGRRAVAFVTGLGFAEAFAGFERATMAATLEVDGRPDLNPLHGYQVTITSEIRRLLRGEGGSRGLLSLPTGAGKTRVTVEALVNAISEGELGTPILWVAQTEELCEQAVQTWSEIWRAFGPTRRLTISRLWSRYEADEVEKGDQVVVATIQKLDAGVFEKDGYRWLAEARCVVVDEAHTSIGPAYTRLLEWQGMGRGRERAPLIGLTATPFRGSSVSQTQVLVGRYGARRLDTPALGSDDAYATLQDLGVLSRVEHELLPGSELALSEQELADLEKLKRLPSRAIDDLTGDLDRNRTLVESIARLDEDWPVLVFCVSKEHAEIMAALLVHEGIPAAAITGETDRGARRHYIDRFRDGELRVLTNYNVLTAGFDAPKVRAVYVARPTFSANLYQQMIGRGLRGPLNGGTESCLLVNVADNILQYGEKLAFYEFDYLWMSGTAPDDRHATAAGRFDRRPTT